MINYYIECLKLLLSYKYHQNVTCYFLMDGGIYFFNYVSNIKIISIRGILVNKLTFEIPITGRA